MKTIADSQDFAKAHKRQRTYKDCPPELVEKYRGRLPDVLLDTWAASGFQEFSNGFLWTVNPDEFRDVVEDFVPQSQAESADVIFRTAFGDLVTSYKGKLYHFSAVTMRSDDLPGPLGRIMDLYFGQKRFLDAIFFFSMFKKALKRLGAPAEDEVYALVPARAMGGEIAAENLEKANLRVYLNYLSQLQSKD
ncbi:GAD-like domain-containing protein [Pyxidicoccus xibeiensis]|uniref:GAD-like domain-containing protein n=1 Tax=Pyxidicoccus xibeiensis TaxID=2906759 RepID=UPI0020A78EF7|nr:GAD-like domain-containing protein [Pyxidicoccus xibeiensis]MCP3140512.1 DUF1851 domain-containing protein [Pyxidicoccus xibeiensis]